ncbi:MAG: glycine cleavage system protein H, partial [Deltaproteobacteria bacterium]
PAASISREIFIYGKQMPDDLEFMMGKYAARSPGDRRYASNHLWLKPAGNRFRVGFTAYSVRLLQDVYFLNWSIDTDTRVRFKQEIGEIESSKAVSSLYAPCDGRVVVFNEKLLNDPSVINTDNYESGWLYEFETEAELLTPPAYVDLLASGWEKTQQMIKGQMNE